MSCPCDPIVIKAAAQAAQPLLGQIFLWTLLLAALLDPFLAVTLAGFAAVLASAESYYLSMWQLFSAAIVLLLIAHWSSRTVRRALRKRRKRRKAKEEQERKETLQRMAADNEEYYHNNNNNTTGRKTCSNSMRRY